jgi:hypothetical protein
MNSFGNSGQKYNKNYYRLFDFWDKTEKEDTLRFSNTRIYTEMRRLSFIITPTQTEILEKAEEIRVWNILNDSMSVLKDFERR